VISKTQWEAMTPEQQANTWFAELGQMLYTAQQEIFFRADNEETLVLSGLTIVVSQRTDLPRDDT
jgi:hypothetical protein